MPCTNNNARLTATFQDNVGKLAPECHLLELKMNEVLVVATGAVRRAKLQSNRHYEQTITRTFYKPDALPVAQPTVSEH